VRLAGPKAVLVARARGLVRLEGFRGTPLADKSYCIAHAPKEAKVARGFGGAQAGSGPKRAKRPHEVAQQLLEYIDVVLAPHFKALGYSIVMDHESGRARLEALEGGDAKVLGESKDGVVKGSQFEDLGAQIAAARPRLRPAQAEHRGRGHRAHRGQLPGQPRDGAGASRHAEGGGACPAQLSATYPSVFPGGSRSSPADRDDDEVASMDDRFSARKPASPSWPSP
jgi:hypothetical protein